MVARVIPLVTHTSDVIDCLGHSERGIGGAGHPRSCNQNGSLFVTIRESIRLSYTGPGYDSGNPLNKNLSYYNYLATWASLGCLARQIRPLGRNLFAPVEDHDKYTLLVNCVRREILNA